MKNIMKCIRTEQIHDDNSNIIYTQYKQHKASTKNTHTPPPSPHTYDLTDDVNEAVQLMLHDNGSRYGSSNNALSECMTALSVGSFASLQHITSSSR